MDVEVGLARDGVLHPACERVFRADATTPLRLDKHQEQAVALGRGCDSGHKNTDLGASSGDVEASVMKTAQQQERRRWPRRHGMTHESS